MSDDGKTDIPALWGIDPDELYPWTPREGRVLAKAAVWEGDNLISGAEFGGPLPGAPVVLLAPLLEKDQFRIQHARDSYRILKAKSEKGEAANPMDAYPDELISDILRKSVKGFHNLRTKKNPLVFEDNWEKDSVKISRWMAQIFLAIIDGSAYTDEEMQAFTLPQESPAA